MKYYSMPADFKQETIGAYGRLHREYPGSRVIETYGNITVENFFESGRAADHLPRVSLPDLRDYIEYSRARDIEFNYTFNATTMQNREFTAKGAQEIKTFLRKLYDNGVRSLTVTLPPLIELVRSMGLDFRIKASTLCQVTNGNKAAVYKRMGMERIVADESVNRDFRTLSEIVRAFGDGVEIIVNPLCHKNCIYRMFHYNQIACDSVGKPNPVGVDFYEHRCLLQRYNKVSDILRLSWVRPEDIKVYEAIGINYFKLQGRHTFSRGGDPARTVECYFKEDFDGNLLDILSMFGTLNSFDGKIFVDNKKLDGFLKPFAEEKLVCRKNCPDCKYCETAARKAIDYEKAEEVIRMAKQFYHDYDSYGKMLDGLGTAAPEAADEDDLAFGFE